MTDFILRFAEQNPIITFFVLVMVYFLLRLLLRLPFLFWNRLLRHLNIRAQGWPTNPLMDADGDIIQPKNED